MRLIIEENKSEVAMWVATYVKKRINEFNPSAKRPFVLGLPTGSSPLGTYQKLIEFYKDGSLRLLFHRNITVIILIMECSFEHVVTFNMDEYVGIPQDHPESYHSFMWTNLFQHVNIK